MPQKQRLGAKNNFGKQTAKNNTVMLGTELAVSS